MGAWQWGRGSGGVAVGGGGDMRGGVTVGGGGGERDMRGGVAVEGWEIMRGGVGVRVEERGRRYIHAGRSTYYTSIHTNNQTQIKMIPRYTTLPPR